MRLLLKLLVVCWAASVAGAAYLINRYENTPCAVAAAPRVWPLGSELARNSGQATVVLVVHPRCPCATSSLGQLQRLSQEADKFGKPPLVYVLFTVPEGPDADWMEGQAWRLAHEVPGAYVLADKGGLLAAQFGALTSGQVVVYGSEGNLLFQGGLTAMRGLDWAGPGFDKALAALQGRQEELVASAPVFGCSLVGQAACADVRPEGKAQ